MFEKQKNRIIDTYTLAGIVGRKKMFYFLLDYLDGFTDKYIDSVDFRKTTSDIIESSKENKN